MDMNIDINLMDIKQLKQEAIRRAQQQREKEEQAHQQMIDKLNTIKINPTDVRKKQTLDQEKQRTIEQTIQQGISVINQIAGQREQFLRDTLKKQHTSIMDQLYPLDTRRRNQDLTTRDEKRWDLLDMADIFIRVETGRYQQGYSIRTIPYYLRDESIHLLLVKVHSYHDWTAFGGKCNEPNKKSLSTRHACASTELYQESRLLFKPLQYHQFASSIKYNLLTYNYYNTNQKKGYQYEFLQFLPITEEFAQYLLATYDSSETKSQLPKAELGEDLKYYTEYGETVGINSLTFEQFTEHIMCSLEYLLRVPPRQCSARQVTDEAYLNGCFDTNMTRGLLTQMIKYIDQVIHNPLMVAEKEALQITPEMVSLFDLYLPQIYPCQIDWSVLTKGYTQHDVHLYQFIDQICALIFMIIQTDLRRHHPSNVMMTETYHTSRFLNFLNGGDASHHLR